MIKLAVSGCRGRMGQRISALSTEDTDFKLSVLLENPNHPEGQETFHGVKVSTDNSAVRGCDVMIDFSLPEGTLTNLYACAEFGVPMVIGTTGFTPEQFKAIKEASTKIPIVYATNMSIGVNILFKLAEMLAKTVPQNYQVKMTEAHHIHKKDAPSGTAKTLAETIENNSGFAVGDIDSIREGEIIGDHKVVFESGEDTITIEHHAKTRDIFAKGSLVAAKWLAAKPQGLYHMKDVLGL